MLEIGKIKKFETYVPNQDKNKLFLNSTLGKIRTIDNIYPFCYKQIVNRAAMIDVIWFNRRNMPAQVFEVEMTTNFTNAFSKYIALQDFNIKFFIVADKNREKEYQDKLSRDEYTPIKKRVFFLDTEKVVAMHIQSLEMEKLNF